MSKDEESDLRSLIVRLVETELEVQKATSARDDSRRKLEGFLWTLQQAKK